MAITLTTDPASGAPPTNPLAVSDCLQWCLQPDTEDVFLVEGTFATLEVLFPSTISVIPADGSEFTIWGKTFEVDSSLGNSTANAMKISASGSTTGAAFRQMLNANLFFANNTTVEVHPTLFALRNTLVTWQQCGEQGNFGGAQMDVVTLEDAGATVTVTNGVNAEQVSGYSMQVRLLRIDSAETALPVTEFEGLKPLTGCDDVSESCVNYMKDAARLLFTPMPDLSTTSEIDPAEQTLTGRFMIQYGWNYKDVDCQPVSGNFYPSDEVFVVNAAFDTEDRYGLLPYWSRHPDFPPPFQTLQRCLTIQPNPLRLAETSFAWIWFLNAFTGTDFLIGNGTGNPFTLFDFELLIDIYEVGNPVATDSATIVLPACQWHEAMNFNVSPQRIADDSAGGILVSEIGKYDVQVKARNDGATEFAFVCEPLVYSVEHECADNVRDVYFLMPVGGIGTLLCELTQREIEQEGTEICLDTPCNTGRTEAAKYSGRQLANLRSFERVTIRARENYGEQWLNYFRAFKASPDRFLQVKETPTMNSFDPPTWIAKRFNPEPGGVKIYEEGEYIELVATGMLADIPVQFPRNAQ